jgi:hypothetical protein
MKNDYRKIRKKRLIDVEVTATETELLNIAQQAATLSAKQNEKEAEKKEVMQQLKQDLDLIKSGLSLLLKQIGEGKIMVYGADCVEEWDIEEAVYRVWYGDRLVTQRPFNAEELEKFRNNIFTGTTIETDFNSQTSVSEDIRQVMAQEKSVKKKRDLLT